MTATQITTLFWDIGGVVLTNGWDRVSRRRAVDEFGLDAGAFDAAHERCMALFETGRLSIEDYIERTVFTSPRSFTRAQFAEFMYAQSRPRSSTLDLARRIAAGRMYFMATINNEPLELNQYRIDTFGLGAIFGLFVSSSFVGASKPGPAIYVTALRLTQQDPAACVFVDDREGNLPPAERLGMNTVHYKDDGQLVGDLARLGVEVPS